MFACVFAKTKNNMNDVDDAGADAAADDDDYKPCNTLYTPLIVYFIICLLLYVYIPTREFNRERQMKTRERRRVTKTH